jgi:uncharacterized protein YutE (UPF0331/DUF86 family)
MPGLSAADLRSLIEASAGTRQDAAVLNVTRACEAAIDLANISIRKRRLGVPGDAKESFALLQRGWLISAELSSSP